MTRLASVGDIVVDVFPDRRRGYPGGNALNVAAAWALHFGDPVTLHGICGDDLLGDHVVATLEEIGVTGRIRRAHGPTGQALVALDEAGDRRFVSNNHGGVQRDLALRFGAAELGELGRSDVIHTSVFSGVEHFLEEFAALAPVSYDLAEAPPLDELPSFLRHLDVAFLSAGGLPSRERADYARRVLERGPRVVVLTVGAEGALAAAGDEVVEVGVEPVDVVDALGAGDAFIAGFLHEWVTRHSLPAALQVGRATGAAACRSEGAFGHPVEVDDELIEALRVPSGPRRRR